MDQSYSLIFGKIIPLFGVIAQLFLVLNLRTLNIIEIKISLRNSQS